MKTFSGKKNYVFKKSRDLGRLGYRIVKTTEWADGTITIQMKKIEG